MVNSGKAGLDLFKPIVGRGSAFADIDSDGDLDVVFTQLHGKPLLLRNDQALNNQWLRVKLVGSSANREGIGSIVRLTSENFTQWRLVTPVRSYMSQSETVVTFGLGEDPKKIELEVLWPGGSEQILSVSNFNTTILVKEP